MDLELAGGLLHLEALVQAFAIRERTALGRTDNLNALFWQRAGSATTDKVPAQLLRLFGIHQRAHRYVPRHNYLAGPSNPTTDALSREFGLSWEEVMRELGHCMPPGAGYQVWEPSPQILEAVTTALINKRQAPESVVVTPPPVEARAHPLDCSRAVIEWPSTPFSKPAATRYDAYKTSDAEFDRASLNSGAIPSSLERLKVTYGAIHRRPAVWGPRE